MEIIAGIFQTQVCQHQFCIPRFSCPHLSLLWSPPYGWPENATSSFSPLINASGSDTNFLDQSAQLFASIFWDFNLHSSFNSDISACRCPCDDPPCLHHLPFSTCSGRSWDLLPCNLPVVGKMMSSLSSSKTFMFWFPESVTMSCYMARGN